MVEIDTADNYEDLLDRLVTFATANGWTELENTSDKVVLQGEGDGTQEIIVAFQKYADVPGDAYGLHINGYSGYNSGLTFFNQPGAAGCYSLPLWNSSIPYWFIVSSRRIIVVAKVSTTYQMAYAGFYKPYASPNQFPYPMMIGGSYYDATVGKPRFSGLTASASMFWSGRNAGGGDNKSSYAVRIPSGEWRGDYNTWSGAYPTYAYSSAGSTGIFPYFASYSINGIGTLANGLRGTVDGEAVAIPLEIWLDGRSFGGSFHGVVGEIDGIYFVSGATHGSEDIVTIDGDDYLVIQDVFRTGVANYCAVKL